MAGAGYKLFNTGDVLTAAQVNTYLMEQTVMRFATTTARDTALTGVLAEGMICYIDADNGLYKYTGSAWVNIDSGSTSPLTTKGDLYTYSTADARLAVGNNGETLVADSSATTGLRWQGNYAAGKNKLINGDFYINQRAFTSTTTNATYGFDRWYLVTAGDGSTTYSAQTFTPGTAPVAGYEGKNFARLVSASQTTTLVQSRINQAIEDVRTFAGQTVTVSFWAKASSGTPSVAVSYDQYFGSGGSPSADVEGNILKTAITTSWARYSATITIPSISGKTIGTNNDHALYIYFWTSAGSVKNTQTNTLGIQSATIDFWGMQIEAGNTATAFQTATGTLAGELAACQRYYWRAGGDSNYTNYGWARAIGTTSVRASVQCPVQMRVAPTAVEFSTLGVGDMVSVSTAITGLTLSEAGKYVTLLEGTGATGLTAGTIYAFRSNNSTSAYLALSAEL